MDGPTGVFDIYNNSCLEFQSHAKLSNGLGTNSLFGVIPVELVPNPFDINVLEFPWELSNCSWGCNTARTVNSKNPT